MRRAMVQVVGDRARLSREEQHHLVRVRRLKVGQRFVGLDGEGNSYLCELARDGQGWFGKVLEVLRHGEEPGLALVLAQAMIRKERFEWVVQKATELGIRQLVPLISRRTELRPREEAYPHLLRRWHRIATEATKQCGRLWVPGICSPTPLEVFLSEAEGVLLVLDEKGGEEIKAVLQRLQPGPLTLFVGPEGGWEEDERRLLQESGAHLTHLGPTILRAETVPLVVLSLLQYEWGEWKGSQVGKSGRPAT